MFGFVHPMASGNDSAARSTVFSSLLSSGNQLSAEWKTAITTDQRIYFIK